ncbi:MULTISPECIES: type VI secretion system baseplate subunit TssF [unclassified Burkholderia]|uniref:type VI secretion system baseplate subunit TssF n=2 Tax=Burkholderia TaxID=32008 RepID=UPI003593AB06
MAKHENQPQGTVRWLGSRLIPFTLELTAPSAQFAIAPDMLRVLMHATRAFVELDGNGRWRRADMPLAAAGFDDADVLLPPPRDSAIAPFHLLMEYGAFPARFDNLDLNLARLKRLARAGSRCIWPLPVSTLTHVALNG